ncbi:MAG: DUF4202 domain-containing protein [gamma proteobacterium symbiont of Taylorina sp.]|nr:DUF4202 domain-containing protein [gamma proteobacterium symbiont of Taylorina sp.]
MTKNKYEQVVDLINTANGEDPNHENDDDKAWPKELLYSHRMSDMLERYTPQADDVMKLAIRAQHIQRWKSPRDAYPMNKQGYHQWRTALYQFHADQLAQLMQTAGYTENEIERAKQAVSKKALKKNKDTQLLEDVSALVFIEHYMLAFVEKHPEYDEQKWLSIILITWKKVSERGQKFALSGGIKLPESLLPLIEKAIG